MEESITFVGLHVHKQTITVALAESGKRGKVREYGRITNTTEGKMQRFKSPGSTEHFLSCHAAVQNRFNLQRRLYLPPHAPRFRAAAMEQWRMVAAAA